MHIADRESFERKCTRMREDGPGSLHVVADFDKTLTKAFHDGKKHTSSFSLLRDNGYLDAQYEKKAKALFETYYPIEQDTTIPLDMKYKRMDEWWNKHFHLMKRSGLTRDILKRVVREHPMRFRDKIDTFFALLEENSIPLLIFSAGLGDIITELLSQNGYDGSNVHVISNFFTFDHEGKVNGVTGNLIHVLNKGEVSLSKEYTDAVHSRKNVILLGDSEGDVSMTDGVDHSIVLKIGFLNDNVEELLPRYTRIYDAVITGDDDFTDVNELVESILSPGSAHES